MNKRDNLILKKHIKKTKQNFIFLLNPIWTICFWENTSFCLCFLASNLLWVICSPLDWKCNIVYLSPLFLCLWHLDLNTIVKINEKVTWFYEITLCCQNLNFVTSFTKSFHSAFGFLLYLYFLVLSFSLSVSELCLYIMVFPR